MCNSGVIKSGTDNTNLLALISKRCLYALGEYKPSIMMESVKIELSPGSFPVLATSFVTCIGASSCFRHLWGG